MKKFKRLLLLAILFVFSACLSYTLQASVSELNDSSESFIQAPFIGNTIMVSSSRDVFFVLVCEVSVNTTKLNWESNYLFIDSSRTQTYNLKTLFPDFDSLDVTLTSVKIKNIFPFYIFTIFYIVSVPLLIIVFVILFDFFTDIELKKFLIEEIKDLFF